PVLADERVVGAVALGYAAPAAPTASEAAAARDHPPATAPPRALRRLGDARRRAANAAALIGAQVGRRRSECRLQLVVDAGAILASALDFDAALRGIVRLAVDRIADMALAYTVDADGRVRRAAAAHVDPAREPLFDALPGLGGSERMPPRLPMHVIRTGRTVFSADLHLEDIADAGLEPGHVELLRKLAPRSAIMVPLRARGRILGAFGLATIEGGKPPLEERDVALVEALGARTAIAVDNARVYAEAEAALERAEAAASRLSLLQAATAALSRAVVPEDVIGGFLKRGMAALGASGAAVAALAPDEREFVLLALRGMPPEYRERFARFPVDAPYPTRDVARTGRPVFLESFADWRRRYRPNRAAPDIDPASDGAWAALPLAVGDRLLGVLALTFPAPRRFTRADRDFMLTLAGEFAQALERARLYEAEQDARRRAEQASLSKSQFLAVMSHELRTPLTAVIGYADLLASGASGELTERQALQVGRIRTSAWHLVSIIDEILTFARMEAGREQVRLERIDAAQLARAACELLEPQARAHGLELHTDLPAEPLWIRSDPGKLRQILLNLLGNAVKFTDQGGVFFSIAREGDDVVAFTVRDTGPGIEPEQLERIFEPFTQADQSATRSKGGTGLGLTVSRRLAHLLGGDVTVDSTLEQGSTFTLRLPAGGA
ncbi:MAG: GAF domain-containing protein, partial [Gemmatimonadetes bacterium]|nr:GAF domain-containing protein [Gemmatimonadota bacterium]